MFGTKIRLGEYTELAALFFLQAMATGMWLVPLSTVLEAHALTSIRPFAFATTATAAFISPLIFGAMADRHASPVVVLRGLSAASAVAISAASWAIYRGWHPGVVLLLIQVYALCAAPTTSIGSAIVFSRLKDSQRQFGPIRAAATVGWMCGCWVISGINADTSPLAGFAAALTWLGLAAFTFLLPAVPPPASAAKLTIKERLGWDALSLLRNHDHRVVFITAALFTIPIAAFYPYTPPHLRKFGFDHTSAWMSLGQVTEVVAMFSLGALFLKWRLKWIFACGLGFGFIRYAFCAFDTQFSLLIGLSLHGLTYTLFFVTAQIYLNERVDTAWRARAQALMSLVTSGFGSLIGYLGSGFWYQTSAKAGAGARWPVFWGGLSLAIALVALYFLVAYHGQPGRKMERMTS